MHNQPDFTGYFIWVFASVGFDADNHSGSQLQCVKFAGSVRRSLWRNLAVKHQSGSSAKYITVYDM